VAEDFVPENDLEVMMVEAHGGRTPMGAFMTALLSSPVYLAAGEGSAGDELDLAARPGRDGGLYIPAFTARSRLERFGSGGRAVSVPLRDLAATWPEEVSLVLDPGDPVELVLPGPDLRRIAEGERPGGEEAVPAGTTVMVGDPADEPTSVLEAVAAVCAERSEVAAAYRAQLHVDRPGERPHLAIGLVLDRPAGDTGPLRRRVAETATAAGAEQVSVVIVDPGHRGDAIAAYMLERTQPFFERP
jgi:SseB protein C-terminal domain/SseB protein N-terminal domain